MKTFFKKIDVGMWRPARLVWMAPGGKPAESGANYEQELRQATMPERAAALGLTSDEVVNDTNAVVGAYMKKVSVRVDYCYNNKNFASQVDIDNAKKDLDKAKKKSPQDRLEISRLEAEVKRCEKEKADSDKMEAAVRKLKNELLRLAMDTIVDKQRAEFDSHRAAFAKTHAQEKIRQYNEQAKKDPKRKVISEENFPKFEAYILAKLNSGVIFSPIEVNHLNRNGRAELFSQNANLISIESFASLPQDDIDSFKNAEDKKVGGDKATEIMKSDPRISAYVNGLLSFAENDPAAKEDVHNYRQYVIARLSNMSGSTKFDDVRKSILPFNEWSKSIVIVSKYEKIEVDSVDKTEVVTDMFYKKPEIKNWYYSRVANAVRLFGSANDARFSEYKSYLLREMAQIGVKKTGDGKVDTSAMLTDLNKISTASQWAVNHNESDDEAISSGYATRMSVLSARPKGLVAAVDDVRGNRALVDTAVAISGKHKPGTVISFQYKGKEYYAIVGENRGNVSIWKKRAEKGDKTEEGKPNKEKRTAPRSRPKPSSEVLRS